MTLPWRRLMPLLAPLLIAVPAAAAKLPPAEHAWSLNLTLEDELGGPAMTAVGGQLRGTQFRFLSNEGLGVTGGVQPAGYSIEMRFMPYEVSGWRRLIDFKNRSSDTGLYIDDGRIGFVSTDVHLGADVLFRSGVMVDLLLTRDASTNLVSVYVDGVLALQHDDSVGTAVFDTDPGGQTQAWFFVDDLSVPNEATAGRLEHVRSFDRVLSVADALRLAKGKRPPNVLLD